MTREEMMMSLITEYGHENKLVIMFCDIAECGKYCDEQVADAYEVTRNTIEANLNDCE